MYFPISITELYILIQISKYCLCKSTPSPHIVAFSFLWSHVEDHFTPITDTLSAHKLAKRCIEIQPPCRDERQGNISIISVPRKKSMSWLCQLTSWSLVQRLTEHMLLACSLQRDPCISFSMKRFIIRHFSMLNTCVLVVLFSSFFFFYRKHAAQATLD